MQLPIPKLEDTLSKYKVWLKPLLNEKDYENSVNIINNFQNNIGIKLQELLQKQKDIYSNTSWLSSAWFNSYLDGRLTPIIESNFSSNVNFEDPISINSVNRFILALSEVCRKYRIGEFEKVYDARGNEICLSQFQILRGASRVPYKKRDKYNISTNNSNYITCFYKNNLYKIQVIDDNDSLLNIEGIINDIIKNTEYKDYSLSTISFASSDRAFEIRDMYYDYNTFFDVVENSLFNISIFDEELSTIEEKFKFYHYLKAKNTWVYKPLNFIYNKKEEEFYINVEHSFQDGGTILEIVKRTVSLMKENIVSTNASKSHCVYIDEYFDDDYKNIVSEIEKDYFEKISNFEFRKIDLELHNESLESFSKDAIMQFVLQYAQKKAFNEVRGMYEAVDMRDYQYGRTECVRSVSSESIDFISALINNDSDAYSKLKVAEVEHKNRIKACKVANGVNRHLLGLYLMVSKLSAEDRAIALEFFNDIGYKKISENFLSTTSLGYNNYMNYLLFTPVMDKGFGINYNYAPEGIVFVISYYKSETDKANKFFDALRECVDKLKVLK